MNWKYLRCTEDVFLEIPLSLVSRRLNFKSLEMFSQRGGKGGSALCLTHGLAGRHAPGDCLFPWYAYYLDTSPILIKTNSALLVLLLFRILNFFLSCKWKHTCDYKYWYVPVEENMYCYVHPLLKTAAYCAEDRKLGLRNTPVVTFYWRKRNLSACRTQDIEVCQGEASEALLRGTKGGIYIMNLPWDWVWPLTSGLPSYPRRHFRGRLHMSTAPEMMSNQNANNWFALRRVAVKVCSCC